jgi:hypothetical protein
MTKLLHKLKLRLCLTCLAITHICSAGLSIGFFLSFGHYLSCYIQPFGCSFDKLDCTLFSDLISCILVYNLYPVTTRFFYTCCAEGAIYQTRMNIKRREKKKEAEDERRDRR